MRMPIRAFERFERWIASGQDLLPLTRASPARLVLVDLPVDVVVVLEQQERAGQGERIERSPRERGTWS
jgi:hypothetical protein